MDNDLKDNGSKQLINSQNIQTINLKNEHRIFIL